MQPHNNIVRCYQMVDRRPVQQADERFFVEQFLNWFNHAYRSNFQVVSEPNPPEAVIRSSRTTRWVEVSTAFWNSAYAQDLYSFATPDEEHKPVEPGPYSEMEHRTSFQIFSSSALYHNHYDQLEKVFYHP